MFNKNPLVIWLLINKQSEIFTTPILFVNSSKDPEKKLSKKDELLICNLDFSILITLRLFYVLGFGLCVSIIVKLTILTFEDLILIKYNCSFSSNKTFGYLIFSIYT